MNSKKYKPEVIMDNGLKVLNNRELKTLQRLTNVEMKEHVKKVRKEIKKVVGSRDSVSGFYGRKYRFNKKQNIFQRILNFLKFTK